MTNNNKYFVISPDANSKFKETVVDITLTFVFNSRIVLTYETADHNQNLKLMTLHSTMSGWPTHLYVFMF